MKTQNSFSVEVIIKVTIVFIYGPGMTISIFMSRQTHHLSLGTLSFLLEWNPIICFSWFVGKIDTGLW